MDKNRSFETQIDIFRSAGRMAGETGREKKDQEDRTFHCLFLFFSSHSEAGSSVEKSFVRMKELQ